MTSVILEVKWKASSVKIPAVMLYTCLVYEIILDKPDALEICWCIHLKIKSRSIQKYIR